jgi:HAAS
MTTESVDPLIPDYLQRVRTAGRQLSRDSRDELVAQLEEHLRDAAPSGSSHTEVLEALDQLGEPEAIVAEESRRLGIPPVRAGGREWAAILLLLVGGVILPLIGWLVGAYLLWSSRVWSMRDKLLGTLVLPGGWMAVPVVAVTGASTQTCGGSATATHCTGSGTSLGAGVLLVAVVVLPLITATVLALRARAAR